MGKLFQFRVFVVDVRGRESIENVCTHAFKRSEAWDHLVWSYPGCTVTECPYT